MAFDQSKAFKKLEEIVVAKDQSSFIFDFLLAFGSPKATITKLKNNFGSSSTLIDDAISLKNKLYFMPVHDGNSLHDQLEVIKREPSIDKDKIRIIMLTNYEDVLAYDTKARDLLDVEFVDLAKSYAFFLPLAGIEKFEIASEHPADVKAAYKMGQLADILRRHNEIDTDDKRHAFNVFLTRLLFCYYAEDTEIFKENQMASTLQNTTDKSGKDTALYFEQLFCALNLPEDSVERQALPSHLSDFPYVNGGLFAKKHWIPTFTDKARRMVIEIGALEWDQINPDIFGSMFQAVIDPEQRGSLGQHYTSVPNIMKVIQPLFLDDLRDELDKSRSNAKALQSLLLRLQRIRVFDPACGSGNFLLIAYKELRSIEMEAFKALDMLGDPAMYMSGIQLDQFYGIEIDDFAHEIAMLSLWLTENQMNKLFKKEFGYSEPMLPLRASGNIICGNSLRLNWEEVCPKSDHRGELEIFICGNPPFLGKQERSSEQSKEVKYCFKNKSGAGNLDYVACWFILTAEYLANSMCKSSLVSTNSIIQGEQTGILFEEIFKHDVEISFGYRPFKWANSAQKKAAVHVTIIGLRNKTVKDKKIYFESNGTINSLISKKLNPYLIDGIECYVKPSRRPLSAEHKMDFGSMPNDGQFLLLSIEDKDNLTKAEPDTVDWIRPLLGSEDFLNSRPRACLWLLGVSDRALNSSPEVMNRIKNVKKIRQESKREATKKLAKTPHLFGEIRQPKSGRYLLVPRVSSERRAYIPIGFMEASVICTDANLMVPNATLYEFAILTSEMHNDWMRTVAGRLKSDYRYSATLVYNTFPWPEVSDAQKSSIEKLAEEILLIREDYPEMTMAQKYNPDTMPAPLLEAHQKLDKAVEKLYRDIPFENASDRLAMLFKRYETLIAKEQGNA